MQNQKTHWINREQPSGGCFCLLGLLTAYAGYDALKPWHSWDERPRGMLPDEYRREFLTYEADKEYVAIIESRRIQRETRACRKRSAGGEGGC